MDIFFLLWCNTCVVPSWQSQISPKKNIYATSKAKFKRKLALDLKFLKPKIQFLPAHSSLIISSISSSLDTKVYNFMSEQNADWGKEPIQSIRNKNALCHGNIINRLIIFSLKLSVSSVFSIAGFTFAPFF